MVQLNRNIEPRRRGLRRPEVASLCKLYQNRTVRYQNIKYISRNLHLTCKSLNAIPVPFHFHTYAIPTSGYSSPSVDIRRGREGAM